MLLRCGILDCLANKPDTRQSSLLHVKQSYVGFRFLVTILAVLKDVSAALMSWATHNFQRWRPFGVVIWQIYGASLRNISPSRTKNLTQVDCENWPFLPPPPPFTELSWTTNFALQPSTHSYPSCGSVGGGKGKREGKTGLVHRSHVGPQYSIIKLVLFKIM